MHAGDKLAFKKSIDRYIEYQMKSFFPCKENDSSRSQPSYSSGSNSSVNHDEAPAPRVNPAVPILEGLNVPPEYKDLYRKCLSAKVSNYHEIFGLKYGYTKGDLSRAYKKLMLNLHIDKHQASPHKASVDELTKFINGVQQYLNPEIS